ncbi:MAG: CvpA family protein [Clostridia bacterium]|nr:CvpA family protein [Clostridia bacterium]
MTLYLIFLILEIVLIMFGVFMGYRRGMGKALFRFCELVIIAVVSLFVSRSLAFSLVDGSKDMVFSLLHPSAAQMVSSSENAIAFIISLAGALIAPVIFALIFGFLKLITLIGFNSVSGAVIRKAGEGKSSKWGGAAIGAVSGVLVCAVLLSPFFSILYMTGSVSKVEKEELCDSIGVDDDIADTIIEWLPTDVPLHPVSALFAKLSTTATVSDIKYCAIEETPKMLAMFNDFLSSYENAQNSGKDELSVVGSAVSSTVPHMENSQFISGMTSSVLNSVGESIKNGNMDLGGDGELSNVVVDSVADILISVSPDNITDNIEVLVGDPRDDKDDGLIGVMSNLSSAEDIEAFIREGKTEELADILIEIEENPELSETMEAVKDIGMAMFSESVLSVADEQMKAEYTEQIAKSVNEIIAATKGGSGDFEENVDTAKETINSILSAETQTPLGDGESELLAIFVVHYFCTDEYYGNSIGVTSSDIGTFLGLN